ncbi:MAG: holo-[acyl-carrier-protein] synthase [Desulfovibrio sp.]|nr:holo-[acyl-carrier-protein] synthase [Desulfovibrio sp.]
MIVGLGLDVCELDRIRAAMDRHGDRFLRKVLTPLELDGLPNACDAVQTAYVAARFAAKEAAAKALGTGFREGVTFQSMEIRPLPSGKPELALLGRGQELATAMGVTGAHVSLTHGRDTACAVVVLER